MDRRAVPPSVFPFLDHDGPIPFAHRGGATGGPENSMAAFQRAVDLGYRYVETDVRATADGVLLVFHDATLDRVTGVRGRIAQLTYRQVRDARIGGRERIPLLADVLGTWPHLRVNIDVKDAGADRPLAEVINRTSALSRVCIASFSGRRVAAARRALGPALCTALSPAPVALLRASAPRPVRWMAARLPLRAGRDSSVPCLQVPERAGPLTLLTESLVELAHARGLRVHVWTVDDEADMHRLLDLGVDGIMTDDLETLRTVMTRRGVWV